MLTPTELPSYAGLIAHGSGHPASASGPSPPSVGPSCASNRQRGVGTPLLWKIRCYITLSIASALARIPEPVHGTRRHAHRPWTAPSSPQVPWSAFHTTAAPALSTSCARLVPGRQSI